MRTSIWLELSAGPASAHDRGVLTTGHGTTVTGQRAIFTSRAAIDPTQR
jgi:hypothetical protein